MAPANFPFSCSVDCAVPEPPSGRLAVLDSYGILDTPPEEAFDDLTELAAAICEAPIALISLVAQDRQWFKARVGLEVCETPLEVSFCKYTLQQPDELFIVPDATQDPRFAENPLVTGEMGIRFYAGAPLVTPNGVVLGALCVIDRVPRTLTPAQEKALRVLRNQVMNQLEVARQHRAQLRTSEERLRMVTEHAPVGLAIFSRERRFVFANLA